MRKRRNLIGMSFVLALLVASNLIVRVKAAPFTYFADFNNYLDSTPVSAFTEKGLTFSSNGIGITRAWGGAVQVREGGASVTVVPEQLASYVEFNYSSMAGPCDQNALVELYHNGTVVDSTQIGYCSADGTYSRSVDFDTLVISTPGGGNVETLFFDNLGINKSKSPTTPTPTPEVSNTPVPTATKSPQTNTITVDFQQYANGTPVEQFSEPNLTFTSSGMGITRAWEQALQIRGYNASVTIDVAYTATSLQFYWYVAGVCDEHALVELYNNDVLVNSTPIPYCLGHGTFSQTVDFDKVVIYALGGDSTVIADNFVFEVLREKKVHKPTKTPKP